MGRRGKAGDSFGGGGKGWGDFSGARPVRVSGKYPTKETGAGQFGSTAYPSAFDSYNRESRYRRWRAGAELFFGIGKSWSASQVRAVARSVFGPVSNEAQVVTTLFATSGSPERAWHVSCRTRGSILLPQPLTAERVSLEQSDPDPTQHRLILNVAGILSRAQLRAWLPLVGDQFEDSATGPKYPADLMRQASDAVALTLVRVDTDARALVFDLSRPFARRWLAGRLYWSEIVYDPAAPLVWRTAGDRHLCSSHAFECSCPDSQGRSYADTLSEAASLGDRFPRSSAGRDNVSAWEALGSGYYRQWRDIEVRRDERRECKHIEAVRWECGVPNREPADYGTVDARRRTELAAAKESGQVVFDVRAFEGRRLVDYDRWVSSLARGLGLSLDPPGDLTGPGRGVRPDPNPVLWTTADEPEYLRCRTNDLWLRPGTEDVQIFSPAEGGFRPTLSGAPVLEILPAGTPLGPVIVA